MTKSLIQTVSFVSLTAALLVISPTMGLAQTVGVGEHKLNLASESDLKQFTDRRIEIVKSALQLTADQQKYWPAIEEALRSRAQGRETRLRNIASQMEKFSDRSPIEVLRNAQPVEFLYRRSANLAQRATEAKKVADAWQPLYSVLSAEQKGRVAFVMMYVLHEIIDAAQERMAQSEDDDE